jgi:hypothetical protein
MNKFRKNTSEIKTNKEVLAEEKSKFRKSIVSYDEVKLTGKISTELHEKLLAYEYWNRLNHSEVLEEALGKFLSGKKIDELPEKEKNKNRPGRKRK